MNKKLQCQKCGKAEYGEDLYNYDGEILCRYCIVAKVFEGLTPCEYIGICNDKTCPSKDQQIDQLKQQLEESFTEEDVKGLIEDRDKTIKFLQQQLAEKDKEIENLKQEINEWVGHKFVKLQYQKAIQELEKAKEFNSQLVFSSKIIDDFIDQQIKKLKGGDEYGGT